MPDYRAIYKCRLCGEEFSKKEVNKTVAFGAIIALGVGAAESFDIPSMNTVVYKNISHDCKDGSMGLADFYGFRKVEENAI